MSNFLEIHSFSSREITQNICSLLSIRNLIVTNPPLLICFHKKGSTNMNTLYTVTGRFDPVYMSCVFTNIQYLFRGADLKAKVFKFFNLVIGVQMCHLQMDRSGT